MSGRVSRLVKEPLFHFLILGLAIYAGYAWLNPGEAPEGDQTIVVGAPPLSHRLFIRLICGDPSVPGTISGNQSSDSQIPSSRRLPRPTHPGTGVRDPALLAVTIEAR